MREGTATPRRLQSTQEVGRAGARVVHDAVPGRVRFRHPGLVAGVMIIKAAIARATERQAEHTILGMSRHVPRPTPVLRDGRRKLVLPPELVPGDLILLKRGTLQAPAAERQAD